MKAKPPRFGKRTLHKLHQPHPMAFLAQKGSFFLATLSLLAFVAGTMVGKAGWYQFWASVLGAQENILYTGFVTPIDRVPDYACWGKYGGDIADHTFRQVPQDCLAKLPAYDSHGHQDESANYSVGYNGSYSDGDDFTGSHPGVDIRVPTGTPVRTIAAGVVERVGDDSGFGRFIVVKHPNVPDPNAPSKTTTLHSVYAHLSSSLVEEGDILITGQLIGYSGKSGLVTGAHLHFQVDRDEAPWHPYWPFTASEASAQKLNMWTAVNAGLGSDRVKEYTVHPMLLVQSDFKAMPVTVAQSSSQKRLTFAERAAARRVAANAKPTIVAVASVSSSSAAGTPVAPSVSVIGRSIVVSRIDTLPGSEQKEVVAVEFTHDGQFTGRNWETLRVCLLDADGQRVTTPSSTMRDVVLRTSFGESEFRPGVLKAADFKDGCAAVNMLPRGRRTVIVLAQPYGSLSKPMAYSEN